MILAAGYATDLQEADLGPLSETLKHPRRRHDIFRFVPESAIKPIAPTVDELVGG